MEDIKWKKLKTALGEQLVDCGRHKGASGNYSRYYNAYVNVLNLMEKIENGQENTLEVYNGVWRIKNVPEL